MQSIRARALIIDDDAALCRQLYAWLEAEAIEPVTFADPAAGLKHSAAAPCDLALVALRLPSAEGPAVIGDLLRGAPRTRVLAMGAFPDNQQILAAFRAGAVDLLEKPIHRPTLLAAVQKQLQQIGPAERIESRFNQRIGARIRDLRRAAEKSQGQIAEMVGISAAQLSQIELGKTATSTWTLARISAALRTPLATLFEGL